AYACATISTFSIVKSDFISARQPSVPNLITAQLLDRLSDVLSAENGRARHEYVGTRPHRLTGGLAIDAPVHLDVPREFLAQRFYLGQHLRHERLAAETWIDGHKEHHVDLGQHRLDLRQRRGRFDGYAAGQAQRTDLADDLLQATAAGLRMHRD